MGLRNALSMNERELLLKIKESGLLGRGGALFPTWKKIEGVMNSPKRKIIVCNAEESEPGTFKDRFIIERNPFILIEGVAIVSKIIKAEKAFIYLRKDYSFLKTNLERAIKKYNRYFGDIDIKIVISGGGYICGEETAILNSLEGKRPIPRKKPPYPTESGYMNNPTLISNVETFSMIPLIILNYYDPELYLFSISGNVENPGVYEEKIGVKLEKLLRRAKPKGNPEYIFFGGSGGFIKYDPSIILDNNNLKRYGCSLGTRSIIVVNDTQNILEIIKHLTEFFIQESCGYCTPCREGNLRVLEILEKFEKEGIDEKSLENLKDLVSYIAETSRCPLGRSSVNHISCALNLGVFR